MLKDQSAMCFPPEVSRGDDVVLAVSGGRAGRPRPRRPRGGPGLRGCRGRAPFRLLLLDGAALKGEEGPSTSDVRKTLDLWSLFIHNLLPQGYPLG